ncbi:MAG TPA: AsmA-like C-terminal region-containing protein [Hyphomicrobium sp.]
MKRPRQTLRRSSLAVAILLCLVFLITAPYLVERRFDEIGLRGAAVYAASRDSYSLSSPIPLLHAPRIALESGTISMPPDRSGLARGGEVIAMLITGSSARMTLQNATIAADFSAREAVLVQGSAQGGVAPLVAALRKLQFDALAVRDSQVRIKLADGAILVLDDVTADITAKQNGTIRAVGSFGFRGEKVTFDTTLATKIDAQRGSYPVSASLSSPLLGAGLDGHLLLGESPRLLSPQADLTIPNVRAAARWLGAGWPPGNAFEDFHAKGQLEWVNHTVAFQNATVQMDGNEATGTLSVNFSGPRPALDGTLGLKTLDLSKYVATSTDAQPASQQSLLSMVSAASGLEFPLIKSVDADLRLSSSSVVLAGVTIGRSAATISLRGGKMIADIAELEIDDGTRGGGQLRIDASGSHPSYDIRGKLEALDLGRAGQAIFGHPTIQGRGDVIVEISAAGDSGETLLGSLDGKLCVTLAEGGQLGIDVDQLTAAAKSEKPQSTWHEASTGAMPVDTLEARFAVAKGVIRTQSAEAVAGDRAVKAEGAINLPTRRLDLELAIGNVAIADTTGAATPQKSDLVDMHGPWLEPTLEPSKGAPMTMPSTQPSEPR